MKRVLDPMERISEVLFGLIMALTITGAVSAAEAGQAELRTMVFAALGCNLAWGIIDGGMYLMGRLAVRGHGIVSLRELRGSASPEAGSRIVADALPPLVAAVLTPDQLDTIRRRLLELPGPPRITWLDPRDWLGALAVGLLVFLSTFPIVVPFLLVEQPTLAMRLSNAVGVAMLFLTGFAFGRHAGLGGWRVGAAMVVVGIVLVLMTIALGG